MGVEKTRKEKGISAIRREGNDGSGDNEDKAGDKRGMRERKSGWGGGRERGEGQPSTNEKKRKEGTTCMYSVGLVHHVPPLVHMQSVRQVQYEFFHP